MIRCTNLGLQFQQRELFRIDDLVFDANMIHIIQGDNGTGKSSLFRTLIGWIQPTQGEIKIEGTWTYQPQHFYLFQSQVKDNFSDLPRAQMLMQRLDLMVDMNHSIQKLSGGERQKVAFIRTLLTNSDIYLFDEPTSNMDTPSKKKVYDLMETELLQKNKTVLLITHEENQYVFSKSKQYRIEDRMLCPVSIMM